MLKSGHWRAVRNIPIGWLNQALLSTDSSERVFRILLEAGVLVLSVIVLSLFFGGLPHTFLGWSLLVFIVHTFFWFLNGNFWVYMLDSFLWIGNTGINKTLEFTKWATNVCVSFDSIEYSLIYGSMCRNRFHNRSDLDLRFVRRRRCLRGLLALPLAFIVKSVSFFKLIPVDLQVVDSLSFLNKQMRYDEKPIIVYHRQENDIPKHKKAFEEILANSNSVIR